MLLGTTFAWFTDTAETGTSVIKAGNLDIELEYKDATGEYVSAEGKSLLPDNILWEPGYTAVIYARVINKGNLAIKYSMNIIVAEAAAADPDAPAAADLTKVIDVYYFASDEEVVIDGRDDLTEAHYLGTLYDILNDTEGNYKIKDTLEAPEGDEIIADYATVALVMRTDAGNEYKNASIGNGFSFQVVATQAAVEEDAFGSDYDASATFPG
jgi:predicted ribosomally synthesized peptide with SipW-like signal peptide